MRRTSELLISGLVILQLLFVSTPPVFADDQVGIEVNVLNPAGAPTPTISFNVPVGVKANAAKVAIIIEGLEASQPVFFSITPVTQAFARKQTDGSGNLSTTLSLPYGIEPGTHTMMARTVFGKDEISASYTVGTFYVNDFGFLTNSDGSYPKGVKQAPEVAPNAPDAFPEPPEFENSTGAIRISEPQIRVTQSLLPSATIGLSFLNAANVPVSFDAKITLKGPLGLIIGEVYYAKFLGIESGGTRTVLLEYLNLPPVGIYTLHTELILPADLRLDTAVETSHSSNLFIFPWAVFVILSVLILLVGTLIIRHKRSSRNEIVAS